MPSHLECRHVSFAYLQKPPVLENITLTLAAGSFTWLRGPSGSGKSTFLRLLCRLLEPSEGEIYFAGRPLAQIDPPSLRRQVVYLHQTPVVLDASLRENLLLPFSFRLNQDLVPPEDQVLSLRLQEFLLQGVTLETPAGSLSVGQKQRLCLLRAMLLGPAVLLLDEPVAALDKESAGVVLDMVKRLHREQGVTILMVAHGEDLRDQPGISSLELKGTAIVTV
jgi:putative ABC transport system ATP-binding protein